MQLTGCCSSCRSDLAGADLAGVAIIGAGIGNATQLPPLMLSEAREHVTRVVAPDRRHGAGCPRSPRQCSGRKSYARGPGGCGSRPAEPFKASPLRATACKVSVSATA